MTNESEYPQFSEAAYRHLDHEYFTNAHRVADKDTVNKSLPYPTVLEAGTKDLDNPSDELLRSVARELNYFDFLASGVLNREIDERFCA